MPLSFRNAADLRRWQPAAGFDVHAHVPFFSREDWGRWLPSGTDGLPRNVRSHLRVTPEGISLHAGCWRCGARHEAVVDFRSLDESCFGIDGDAASFEGFGLERAQYLEYVLLQHPLRAWADRHLRCAPSPALSSAPELPFRVAEVVHLMEVLAENDLREQGTAEATVVLVPGEGAPLWLDLDGYDEAARALTAFRVREITDRDRRSQYTLVTSEESPGPGTGTCWRMTILEPDRQWSAVARVERPRGMARGPGLMDLPTWVCGGEPADWVDGLRAPRIFFPITRPGQEAA